MNSLLVGQASFIDLLQPQVRTMLENEGIYIAGDTASPGVTTPLVSLEGEIRTLEAGAALDPETMSDTLTLQGPFHKDSKVTNVLSGVDIDIGDCKLIQQGLLELISGCRAAAELPAISEIGIKRIEVANRTADRAEALLSVITRVMGGDQ